MFCIVNNIVVCIVHHIVVFLTILWTIQNKILSYCHIVSIVTILHILSCIVNNIAKDWFADARGFLGRPRAGGQGRGSQA
jgi:hypothetical protein